MLAELNAVDAIALGLSTFYLAFVMTRTHGPFNVFKSVRERWPLGGLTTCMYCLCVWVALFMWLILQIWPPGLYIIAASGASAGMYRYTGGEAV